LVAHLAGCDVGLATILLLVEAVTDGDNISMVSTSISLLVLITVFKIALSSILTFFYISIVARGPIFVVDSWQFFDVVALVSALVVHI